MDKHNGYTRIIADFAAKNGIIWGVCDAAPLTEMESVLSSYDTPFVSHSPRKRVDPATVLPQVRNIIAVGKPYDVRLHQSSDTGGDVPRGRLSAGAVGEDYHRTLHALLTRLAAVLSAVRPFVHAAHVDSGPLLERAFANRAGLGAYGRNTGLISEEIGSFFHIGLLLTDLDLPLSLPADKLSPRCAGCRNCVDACPAEALSMDAVPTLAAHACVSYLTQKKGVLTAHEQKIMGDALYGCDICRRVCPANVGAPYTAVTNIDDIAPKLTDILALTKRTFKARYGHSAASWRGLCNMQRNVYIIQNNAKDLVSGGMRPGF